MTAVPVLLTGDFECSEFADAVSWLVKQARVHLCSSMNGAEQWLRQAAVSPLATVVAQARPGQFANSQIEQLHAAAPMARIVALLGSWCEGETVSGTIWPGVHRVYWHQWTAQCGRELAGLHGPRADGWSMPRTATDFERMLNWTTQPQSQHQGRLGIYTWRPASFQWLSEACQPAGYSTTWLNPRLPTSWEDVDVVIWDGSSDDKDWPTELGDLAVLCRGAPIAALLNFPRPHDQQRLFAAGVSVVLSQPYLLRNLHWHLHQLRPSSDDISAVFPAA